MTNLMTMGFRENGADDVTIKILYCGICHTDLHHIKNDWGITIYPLVPGYSLQTPLSLSLSCNKYFITEIFFPYRMFLWVEILFDDNWEVKSATIYRKIWKDVILMRLLV